MKIITGKHSPNFNDRKSHIDIIVIHYTGMKSEHEALDHLCNKSSKVSSHYLINFLGGIYSLVDEEKRAWHAGVSCWNGDNDINSSSIGIELENPGHDFGYKPFTNPQMVSLESLIRYLISKYNIPLHNIVGHSDIAPLRKKDPGELFDWKRLAKKNLSIWPKKSSVNPFNNICIGEKSKSVLEVQEALSDIGYKINKDGYFGNETQLVLKAFQRRFGSGKFDGYFDNITGMLIHSIKSLTKI
ncbi:MAG: N-acetylmuramoyl-L-alanine amidase AmiD [Alphaproteobacteria bacterium MarineAlpha2_Bin1]|nr:MAG: N-acetylmuramoyl-L-alanine amidase AmiD [Alphaproteobacteria bacterium MarineAlpha2_Bin1]|tara:strand:+ start:465 stop:1193 length:729 start_codon:yes stop_codon:yes gene_type:complete